MDFIGNTWFIWLILAVVSALVFRLCEKLQSADIGFANTRLQQAREINNQDMIDIETIAVDNAWESRKLNGFLMWLTIGSIVLCIIIGLIALIRVAP